MTTPRKVPRGSRVVACGFPRASREPTTLEERVAKFKRDATYLRVVENFRPSDFDYDHTSGTVSRIKEEEIGRLWVQHSAPINPGNSGGPLLSGDGVVVGINTLRSVEERQQGVFFSLATPQIRQEIDALIPGLVWK